MLFRMHSRWEIKFNNLTNVDQIVKMQQVVIEDREEQERLQQLEELARTASKVRSIQGPLRGNVQNPEV